MELRQLLTMFVLPASCLVLVTTDDNGTCRVLVSPSSRLQLVIAPSLSTCWSALQGMLDLLVRVCAPTPCMVTVSPTVTESAPDLTAVAPPFAGTRATPSTSELNPPYTRYVGPRAICSVLHYALHEIEIVRVKIPRGRNKVSFRGGRHDLDRVCR